MLSDMHGGSMPSSFEYPIKCECGHEGVATCRENDAPYSLSWEEYSFEGFEGQPFRVEDLKLDYWPWGLQAC